MWIEQALAGFGREESSVGAAKLRAFELIVLVHLCAERSFYALGSWQPLLATLPLNALATFALAALALSERWRRAAFGGLALVQLSVIAYSFPLSANHNYLILYVLLLLTVIGRDGDEQALLLGSLKWLLVVVVFYAGLQKLVHGYYFHGEFLAHTMARRPWFHGVLKYLVSSDELALIAGRAAFGPYRIESPALLVLSNVAYVTELALAPLLLIRRTRTAGVLLALAFIVVTEAMARELFFGAMYVNLLLLFVQRDLNRRLIGWFVAFYAALIASAAGILPEMTFH